MVDFERRFKRLETLVTCTQKNVLNADEVCMLTGLSKSTIYKLTMKGEIPHYKQAKHLYFDRKEIESWLTSTRGFNVDEINQKATTYVQMKGTPL